MAMTKESYFLPADFINLKARVKAEMNRRNGNGSLTAYAAVGYDYTAVPTTGNVTINEEHFDKLRDPMAAINPATVGLGAKAVGDIVVAMDILEANMTTFEAKPRGELVSNDCSAACTGMCVTVCTTSCAGCTGSCTGDCNATCSGGCDGDCNSGCYTGCYTGCNTSCQGGCNTACDSTCSGSCTSTCAQICSAVCLDVCSGCGNTCWSACWEGNQACSTCTGNCGSGCSAVAVSG